MENILDTLLSLKGASRRQGWWTKDGDSGENEFCPELSQTKQIALLSHSWIKGLCVNDLHNKHQCVLIIMADGKDKEQGDGENDNDENNIYDIFMRCPLYITLY